MVRLLETPMKYSVRWALFLAWIALSLFLLYRIYGDARKRTLKDLNAIQTMSAQQAVKGIKESITRWIDILNEAAKSRHIVDLDGAGKDRIAFILGAFGGHIRAVTRVNEHGKIFYTLPEDPKVIGLDITSQEHVRKILTTRTPVISDVFKAVQGYPAIAVHVPVFSGPEFRGTLAVLLDFREIGRGVLDGIRIGTNGTVHLVTAQGIEIYSSLRGHEGKSVFETVPNSSGFMSVLRQMLQRKEGLEIYLAESLSEKSNERQTMHAAYLPIHFSDTFWSLAITFSEKEALLVLESLRLRLILVVGLLFLGGILFVYLVMRAWEIVKEHQKREEAEKHLMFERAQLLSILDSIDATICVADLKTHEILFLNRHMKTIFGEDAVGKKCFQVFRGESSPCSCCNNERLLDAEGDASGVQVWEGQNPITHKWYINYDRAISWIDGRMVRLQVASDITERRQMEEALRTGEEKYRSVLEAGPDPMVVYDMEGRVVYFNHAFTEVFGWSLKERAGKKLDDFVPEEAWPETRAMIQKVLSGERFLGVKTLRLTKDGKKIPVAISGAFTRDKDNKILNSIIAIRDITEEKKVKAQLQQAMKMEAIGTLSGGIAHEFNNILAIILGNTELALENVPEWNPARHNLKESRLACVRARDVVRQLLSFSRKSEVKKGTVQMASLVKESLRLLRASIPSLIEIRASIDEDAGSILGDATQIHQVLINLCTNARDAMQEEGGIMEIRLNSVAVNEGVDFPYPNLNPGRYVALTVKDTGKGIDPQDIDRIFDPFFTTKEVGQGTGMGLAVVHGIVKAHNGMTIVNSERGKGTTFTLLFPATDKSSEVALEPEKTILKGKERILFVDDEESVVHLNNQILQMLGYRVKSTPDSVEALEWFRSDPKAFDLVITDMTMPKMTGLRLAQTLLEIRPDIPIILCTGFSERISEEKAKKEGIRAMIMKPIEIAKLSTVVRSVLDQKPT